MCQICGVIAEYNPFHNGHLEHLQALRQITGANYIVAIMSGNFVQRGEPAIIDKFKRTQAALLCGADIVLELPAPYATASAEAFASGACLALAATNMVDSLCFGSESGDINELLPVAEFFCNEKAIFKQSLRDKLAQGVSFAHARAYAAEIIKPDFAKIISSPNNILAVEYLKAIIKYSLPLKPYTIKRQGAGHDSLDFLAESASASAIRKHVFSGGSFDKLNALMPAKSLEILRDEYILGAINQACNLSPFLHYSLKTNTKNIWGLPESLYTRIVSAADEFYPISEIINTAKAKNHTHSSIRRAVLHIILGINAEDSRAKIPYLRILGFSKNSAKIVGELHKRAQIPVITNLKNTKNLPPNAKNFLNIELRATEIYWLGLKAKGLAARNEKRTPMVII